MDHAMIGRALASDVNASPLAGASDVRTFTDKLGEVRNQRSVPLASTRLEEHWGLLWDVRQGATETHKYRSSAVYQNAWEEAKRTNGWPDQPLEVSDALLVRTLATDVLSSALTAFRRRVDTLLTQEEVTIKDMTSFLGDGRRFQLALERNQLEKEVTTEMDLLFPPRGLNFEQEVKVRKLKVQVEEFARITTTMSDAKAVVSLVANICGPDHSSDTPGLYQAALNVVQLDSADVAMDDVAKTARSFRQLLEKPQFDALRSVVGPLGDERAKDLLQFVGGIDDLRVLVDSAVDAVVSASTVSSVQGLGPILKPFLSIPPSRLHGNEDAFCERFAALLEANQTTGVNVAAQLIDCCNNIHGLERLQRNISDKSAQTKEIISAIVEHGQWHFKVCATRI